MRVGVTPEETAVLVRWRKRSDNHVLVRMKTEAILYASEGVGIGIIAKMVERAERTVQEWLADWQATRMCSVLTGHAGNQNAAKLTRDQKQELKKILAQPPSQTGIHAEFWDVPAIRDVVKIMFDVEHQSDSSYQLLLRFCGLSFKLPDPFDKHRNEKAITRRMAWATTQVKALLDAGWEVYAVDEVRLEHEAWTRRMQPPKKGSAPGRSVDRQRTSQSFSDALPRPAAPDRAEPGHLADDPRTGPAPTRNRGGKIAVVPDNARPHHAKALTGLHGPGRLLERITPIHLPPYAPDHNPVEHVWNTAKNNIANIQRETPEETFGAFASYVTGRAFDYDFEHLPLRETRNDFVS